MGWLDKDDIACWVNWIIEKDNQAQIILHGVSMGGATVMMASGDHLPHVVGYIEDCGYTSVWDIFEMCIRDRFKDCRGLSRYNHSIGVALIVYHFTHDKHQTIAALLHDIATPVFAHVIDFMYHDYIHQETTENLTEEMIQKSLELQSIFEYYHIDSDKVMNYHDYRRQIHIRP